MMKAKKSLQPDNAKINRNFFIKVRERLSNGQYSRKYICSANTLSMWLQDEKLKISLFKTLWDSGVDQYTIKIRSRLIIEFTSK